MTGKKDLEDIKGGVSRTWKNFYDTFWNIALVRYVTARQLREAFPKKTVWRAKCATPKMLQSLAEKGYLNLTEGRVFTITNRGLNFLKTYAEPEFPEEFNTNIIKLPQGKGERDTLYNTDVLLKVIQLKDFCALFYPDFYEKPSDQQPFLIPDGALVLKRGQNAKLIFLEIERKKPGWESYLKDKKWKYETIAERQTTWSEWWRNWSEVLRLQFCQIEQFGFSVWCIGGFRADWEGWSFKKEI